MCNAFYFFTKQSSQNLQVHEIDSDQSDVTMESFLVTGKT